MADDDVFLSIYGRYSILLIVALTNVMLGTSGIFYKIFTPLTVYPSFLFFKLAYNATLISETVIFFKGYYAQIIPACVAGAAYFLLFILVMTTPMPLKKRLVSLVFLCTSFLLLNVARIIIFGSLVFKGYQFFDVAHLAFWYIGSTLMMVLLWFANVFLLKIDAIPIISDISQLTKAWKHN